MHTTNDHSSLPSTTIIIQPQTSRINFKRNKLVFRLGWISFILGFCAYVIHYISIDRLANFSPINAGIISGFLLIIAGLASVAAGYQEKSYRCFIHAQIWSFIANIILAPGLIAISIAALILDNQDIHPICQTTVSLPRGTIFVNNLEAYSSNVPCMEVTNLFNLTQILNTIQLIIGVLCFFVHIVLISIQRKVIEQMKIERNDRNKIIVDTEPTITYTNHTICYADTPPKYEDLPPRETISE
ncbi:unnamed protein product [Rotaria sp. Silwood2]|nr:unnamed protein product [Rotaria sp. Silwood2]CAF2494407.1 unnamed protein product [Rotaria sp. Silwood2]CAF2724206.1 unnamed protein product [Rotaria sp. Silwood2]CAF4141595.1 unnamed protein product [Rotaria sp. Silwood2]CAF4255654.1 unnamed protein product [Rotaria sp. Silwood2]